MSIEWIKAFMPLIIAVVVSGFGFVIAKWYENRWIVEVIEPKGYLGYFPSMVIDKLIIPISVIIIGLLQNMEI